MSRYPCHLPSTAGIKNGQGEFIFNGNAIIGVLLNEQRQKAVMKQGAGAALWEHEGHSWAHHCYPFSCSWMA